MAEEDLESFISFIEGDETLPRYDESSRARRKTAPTLSEHVITDKKHPWAFLKVKSRTKNLKHIPMFVQGDNITGTVELNLEKPENLRAVAIHVWGETWSGEGWAPELQAPTPFWYHTITLWSTSNGEHADSNLKGKYVWPFSISIPSKVVNPSNPEDPVELLLPPRFLEKSNPVSVDYRISATFSRGRFRADHSLRTSFSYVPRTRPEAPSMLRQLAYQEKWPPPGPQADPEGWSVVGVIPVEGNFFGARKVEATCVLALAKPLCYTIGTFVPFAITITCSDPPALDLLAGQGSFTMRLMRTVHVKPDPVKKPKVLHKDITTCVGRGFYWESKEDTSSAETRKLEGEIPIKPNAKPSFEFPPLVVKYYVLLTVTAVGFGPPKPGDDTKSNFAQRVSIASAPGPGPIPRASQGRRAKP